MGEGGKLKFLKDGSKVVVPVVGATSKAVESFVQQSVFSLAYPGSPTGRRMAMRSSLVSLASQKAFLQSPCWKMMRLSPTYLESRRRKLEHLRTGA